MVNMGSGLLIVGQPLMFTKELAVKTSVHMAVFLQQSFFMISRYGKENSDGERWLRWSSDKWHKRVFPFWSERTLDRIMREAEENGWIVVERTPGSTARYALGFDKIEADFGGDRGAKKTHPQGCQKDTPRGCQNDTPVPCIERDTEKREKNPETSAETERVSSLSQIRKRICDSSGSSMKSTTPAKEKLQNFANRERRKLPSAEALKEETRKKHKVAHGKSLSDRPTTEKIIQFWRTTLADYGISSMSLSFTGKERGMMRNLVKQFSESLNGSAGNKLAQFLEFAVQNWSTLRKKIVWDNNPKRSKLHEIPNISEVYYNREDILHYMSNPEEVRKEQTQREVYTDVSKVPVDHPRYRQIVAAIERSGRAVFER